MKSASLVVLCGTALLAGACSQDTPKKTLDQEPVASSHESFPPSKDDDEGSESGNEDEESLPPIASVKVQGTGSAVLSAELNRILSRVTETHYSHQTSVDENAGVFDVDCSGLVDYALKRVLPDAFETVRDATVNRPLAKHYVAFLGALEPNQKKGRWRRIGRADDLIAGDIIAWVKPPESTSHNTGHTMIVRGAPSREGNEIAVPIIDSTGIRHGASDSRFPTKSSGIGTGTIYLLVNSSGAPVGFRWSNGRRARNHGTTITLGRVE